MIHDMDDYVGAYCGTPLLTNQYVLSLAVSGTNLFAGTDANGVFLSTNNGTSWTAINTGLTNSGVAVLTISGTALFAGTKSGGVFVFTNSSTSWAAVNLGLIDTSISALAAGSADLFAGNGDGVWRRPLSEMITAVKNGSDQIPFRFALQQNFPDPFNPSTTISYDLPQKSHVSLIVYDVPGGNVRTLVDEDKPAGSYLVTFDASDLPSGVYFCGLEAGTYHDTKKLLLLR